MKQEEFTFLGADGDALFGQVWQPPGEAQGIMVIVHGLGEYSDRYQNFMQPLTSAGIEVWTYDLRGHGRSSGRRGHIKKWGQYREDLDIFLKRIMTDQPEKDIILYGHSLGSLIVAEYVLRDPVSLKGVILSGVATEPVGVATPGRVFLAKLLSRILPTFSLPAGISGSDLSHISSVIKSYDGDPLVLREGTLRFAAQSLAAIDFIRANTHAFTLPLLILQGEDDPLNALHGPKTFFEDASSADKQIKIYPNTLHEPHNDENFREVIQDITQWVTAHIA